jgi:hypothetical protein
MIISLTTFFLDWLKTDIGGAVIRWHRATQVNQFRAFLNEHTPRQMHINHELCEKYSADISTVLLLPGEEQFKHKNKGQGNEGRQ